MGLCLLETWTGRPHHDRGRVPDHRKTCAEHIGMRRRFNHRVAGGEAGALQ